MNAGRILKLMRTAECVSPLQQKCIPITSSAGLPQFLKLQSSYLNTAQNDSLLRTYREGLSQMQQTGELTGHIPNKGGVGAI